jgi:hypothetical protein
METMVVDLAKLMQLSHMSVACAAVTIIGYDYLPPSFDVISAGGIMLYGPPVQGINRRVKRPTFPSRAPQPQLPDYYCLKIGSANELDLGGDDLTGPVCVDAAPPPLWLTHVVPHLKGVSHLPSKRGSAWF